MYGDYSEGIDELRARGFVGVDDSRLERFLRGGFRRVLGADLAWAFMQDHLTISPQSYVGHATIIEVRRADGMRLTHRSRQTLIAGGHAVDAVGTAMYWYIGPSSAASSGESTIWTCPLDEGLLSVDFFRDPGVVTMDELWHRTPAIFEDVILDAAEIEAAKDAKDWETVQGLRPLVQEAIGQLVERFADQQISDHGIVVGSLQD
jgi:hypothetical protein